MTTREILFWTLYLMIVISATIAATISVIFQLHSWWSILVFVCVIVLATNTCASSLKEEYEKEKAKKEAIQQAE